MKIFITFFALLFCFSMKSMTFTSNVAVGNWSVAATWVRTNISASNTIPSSGAVDTVIILGGHNIKLNTTSYAKLIIINSGGTLNGNAKQLHLRGSFVNNGTVGSIELYYLASGSLSSATTFSSTGNIVVRNGATLTIQAGTTISRVGAVYLNTSSGGVSPKVVNLGNVTLKRGGNTATGKIHFQVSNASWTNGAGSFLSLSQNASFTGTGHVFNASASTNTVVYTDKITSIINTTYSNLHITSNASLKTLTANLNVLQDFLISGSTNTVSVNSRILSVGGNLITNALLTFTTGKMRFNGLGNTQSVSGTNSTAFYDLEINNSGGSVVFNANRTVSNDLIMIAGDCNSNDRLTLVSTPAKTARIAEITNPTAVSFTGNTIIQKFIGAMTVDINDPTTCYYALSSPVQSTNVYDWDSEMYISGIEASPEEIPGPGGVDGNVLSLTESMYTYDGLGGNYVPVTGSLTAVQPGVGYALVFADTYSAWYAKTIDTRGAPNFGDVTVSGLDDNGADAWYLVGNPYACHIDYDLVTKSNILPTAYFIDQGNYSALPTSIIPPHQGFFCDVDDFFSGELLFTESCKVNNYTTEFYRTAPNYDIQLTLSSGSVKYSHANTISFNEEASLNYDRNLDHVYKKFPEFVAPAIYMTATDAKSGREKTLIKNTMDSKADEVTMPLSIFTPVAGVYHIDASVLNLDTYTYAWIENKITGTKYDLNSAIAIEGKEQATNTDYVLRLSKSKQNAALAATILETDLIIFSTENAINIKSSSVDHQMKEVTVYDMTGKIVLSQNNVSVIANDIYKIDVTSLATGVYIVKAIDEQGRVISRKLLK